MALLSVALVLAAMSVGIASGLSLSLKCFCRAAGFCKGAAIGGIVTLLTSLMCGQLLAGLGEEWLGTTVGVPLGLGAGCFVGAYTANTIAGAAGFLIARVGNRSH